MALSTAARFITGSTPGRAMSTALAWVLGAAPKAVLLPEKIFDWVESWAWTSSPITTSHFMPRIPCAITCLCGRALSQRRRAGVPVGGELELMGGAQHGGVLPAEVIANQLHAHRAAIVGKPAGRLMPGRPARFTASV